MHELRRFASRLESSLSLTLAMAGALRALLQEPAYGQWFANERLVGKPYRGQVPDALVSLDLAHEQGGLLLQAHELAGRLFVTDAPAADKTIRVYPYQDESARVHECAQRHGLYQWAEGQTVVDLACGCGHHAIAWPGDVRRILLDKSDRALAYAQVNLLLNKIRGASLAENDVRQGLRVVSQMTERTVILANMPFALSPIWGVLPGTSDGGTTGASWTLAALEAIKGYWQLHHKAVRAVVLCYSVGASPTGPWEVGQQAQNLFREAADLEFALLTDEKMVRIDGHKRYPVPVTTDQFADRANCRLDVPDADRDRFRRGYANLIEVLGRDGWTHVGYGTLYVDLPVVGG
jgi:hypothetical protein